MNKYILSLCLIMCHCSWLEPSLVSDGAGAKIVKASIVHFNTYNEDSYSEMFDENVNYFVSNGLGTTRFATGRIDLKKFNSHFFKSKKSKISIINMFESGSWVFVQQRTNTGGGGTIEASVGYRIDKKKIADVMVIGETRLK